MTPIDKRSLQIEATIQQILSGLPKTYVPFMKDEIFNGQHIAFAHNLKVVCEQDYQINICANKMIIQFGWYWLEVEYLGEFHYFPNILT